MKKLLKKKVNVFGKSVPVFAIFVLGIALVSAALLPYFGLITGNVTVSQGLLVDGLAMPESGNIQDTYDSFTSLESMVFASAHRLSNGAEVGAEVDLEKEYLGGTWTGGITANYYETNLREGILVLAEKNPSNWEIVENGMEATLTYTFVDGTFSYGLSATGLEVDTEYVLIYYADQPDRFVVWGGAPALELGRWTATTSGTIDVTSESEDIPGSLLPYPTDWNAGTEANYCATADNYEHCRGAKIWLIPSNTYNGGDVVVDWEPTRFLFETDLLGWNHENGEITESLTVTAGQNVDFVIVSNFPKMTYPDTYTVTTTVTA